MDMEELLLVSLARKAGKSDEARQLRLAQELTLREAAGSLGVDAASLSRWERGETTPKGRFAIGYGRLLATWMAVESAEPGDG
jgi:DNA-binding transcriptional regulator YiaG